MALAKAMLSPVVASMTTPLICWAPTRTNVMSIRMPIMIVFLFIISNVNISYVNSFIT